MRVVIAAVAIGLLATPASAQFSTGGDKNDGKTRYSEAEKRAEAERERQYRNTIENTRTQAPEAINDPWATVRPTPGKR